MIWVVGGKTGSQERLVRLVHLFVFRFVRNRLRGKIDTQLAGEAEKVCEGSRSRLAVEVSDAKFC